MVLRVDCSRLIRNLETNMLITKIKPEIATTEAIFMNFLVFKTVGIWGVVQALLLYI